MEPALRSLPAATPDVDVYPDLDGIDTGDLTSVVGALLTITLILAVLMLVATAIAWAISSSTGSYHAAAKAQIGIWISLGVAILTGGAVVWINTLLAIGQTL